MANTKSAVHTYLESLITMDPSIRINSLFSSNGFFFEDLGLDYKDRDRLSNQLKFRFNDWKKYGYAENPARKIDLEPGEDLSILTYDDLDIVKSMIAEGVIRVPITDLKIMDVDGKKALVMPRRKEVMDFVILESYAKGDYGSMLFLMKDSNTNEINYDELQAVMDQDPDKVRSWAYVKFTGKTFETEAPARAY